MSYALANSVACPSCAARVASRANSTISSTTTATELSPTSAKNSVWRNPDRYYGLGALFVDVNNDGKPDLAVANDSSPNYLYINKGDGTFENQNYASGYAVNGDGREVANMGIAAGDYENNGQMDLVNTTFSDDYKLSYQNDGTETLPTSAPTSGWRLHGSVSGIWRCLHRLRQRRLEGFAGCRTATSTRRRTKTPGEPPRRSGPCCIAKSMESDSSRCRAVEGTGLADVIAGRGMAVGDLFNDGKVDAVINVIDGHPVLLRNVNPDHNHWLELKLVGGPKSPRDAVGAAVYLTANGLKQRDDVISGGSYLSSNDPRVHFGLGAATKIDSIEVHWPSGAVEHFTVPDVDRIVTLKEGTSKSTAP